MGKLRLKQSLSVDKGSRLYHLMVRAFHYQDESTIWFLSKTTKNRFHAHSEKIFHHVHWVIKRELGKMGLDWSNWKILREPIRCSTTNWVHGPDFRIEDTTTEGDNE